MHAMYLANLWLDGVEEDDHSPSPIYNHQSMKLGYNRRPQEEELG